MQLLPQGLPVLQCGAWPVPALAVAAGALEAPPDECVRGRWGMVSPFFAGADDAATGHLTNLWVVGSLHLVAASADIAVSDRAHAANNISDRFMVSLFPDGTLTLARCDDGSNLGAARGRRGQRCWTT